MVIAYSSLFLYTNKVIWLLNHILAMEYLDNHLFYSIELLTTPCFFHVYYQERKSILLEDIFYGF